MGLVTVLTIFCLSRILCAGVRSCEPHGNWDDYYSLELSNTQCTRTADSEVGTNGVFDFRLYILVRKLSILENDFLFILIFEYPVSYFYENFRIKIRIV